MMSSVSKDRKMRKRMQKQFGNMDPDAIKELQNAEGVE